MLGMKELDRILDPDSSDTDILNALAKLGLDNLTQEILDAAVNRITMTADLHPDLALELYELGRFSMDCSGTGGSGTAHYNTSTSVAFVLAAAGFKIAKFGARAASGKSGSFDFLECLGFPSDLPLARISDALSVCGISFIFAPTVYPHLRRLAPLRRQHGSPTVLNFIGPLLNPVHPATRMMGISSDIARKCVAEHLKNHPRTNRAMLVTGGGKLDEFALDSHSEVSFIENAILDEYSVDPDSFVFKNGAVQNGFEYDAKTNSKIFLDIIDCDDTESHAYKMIVLNSGAALYLLKACKSINEGIALAAELIASEAVAENFQTCRRFYAQLSR